MAANDDDESTAVIVGVLAGIVLAVVAVVYGASAGKGYKPASPAAEQAEIAPVGEALAKVYFAIGKAELDEADKGVVGKTLEALGANPKAIVLLSGFHDPSGDAAKNAELAKAARQGRARCAGRRWCCRRSHQVPQAGIDGWHR
jgi:hypothetical protein